MNKAQLAVLGVCLAMPLASAAGDGVIEINQARALAGGVTPGDGAGFPVTISASGSYRLTGDISAPLSGGDGIAITASDVHLDLNGFSVYGCGVTVCLIGATGDGIDASGASNVTVLDGRVRGHMNRGVAVGERSRVEGLTVVSVGEGGIHTGSGSQIRRNTVSGTGGGWNAIYMGYRSIAADNVVSTSGGSGIRSDGQGIVSGNIVTGCSTGIAAFSNSLVTGNTVSSSTFQGLFLDVTVAYSGNALYGNNGGGPQVYSGVQIGQNLCGTTLCP